MNEECQCPLETNPNARLGLCTSVSLPSPPPPISYYICSKTFAGTHYSPFSCGSDLCWYFRRFVHVISMCTHSSTNNCLQFMQTNKRSKMLKVFFSLFSFYLHCLHRNTTFMCFSIYLKTEGSLVLSFLLRFLHLLDLCVFFILFFLCPRLFKNRLLSSEWSE